MNLNDFKKSLEDLIHDTLYLSSTITNEQSKSISKIKNYLKKSDNIIDDIRIIVQSRNNETSFAYDPYIKEFLLCSDNETKKNIISNFSQYGDLIKDDDIYISLWLSLSSKEKVSYLESKKKYSSLDILLINTDIKDNNSFKENIVLKSLINNDKINKKIDSFSLNLNYCLNVTSLINLKDYDICSKLTKESYTKLLLKKYKSFSDFLELYYSNKKIFNLIEKNSLIFNNNDNEAIYEFILENPEFIGKFNKKYLDLYSIIEITKISKSKSLDSDAYSSIIERLYKFNPDKANTYFSEESLRKCSKHSISIYPFHDLSLKISKHIFDDYTLFNKFIDTIMIEAINDNFAEDDIVNILRNDTFIEDMSSYGIELLINKLSFKASFNMLQRKVIFNKITHLNVKVTEHDTIFLKGYLDSPILVNKSEHNMLYEMLNLLSSNDILYYISLPYIIDNLSNYEIINLTINKNLPLKEILFNQEIKNKFNLTDTINLIDKSFATNVDLSVLNNKDLLKELFNLKDETIDSINLDEVNYLFETIRMKSLLSKQDSKITVISYKSVLACYLTLGLNESLKMINDGNKDITLNQINSLKSDVINEKILLFKENNSSVFQNMAKKITHHLLTTNATDELSDFAEFLRKNTYLDNIIYLMLDNNFDSYNNIISRLYSFARCLKVDELGTKKDIYEYTKHFTDIYLYNKVLEYEAEFDKIILKNFKVLESVTYRKRKELGNIFIDNLKFKLFVRSLTDSNKDNYRHYYIDNFPIKNIKELYLEELESKTVDFASILEHVLTPIMNDRFDKENCLSKLGIKKPDNTDVYLQYLKDKKNISKLNKLVKKLKNISLSYQNILAIMEYITYNKPIPYELTKKELNKLNKYKIIYSNISTEIYIKEPDLIFSYNNFSDIYNVDEITNYIKYLKILDDIIKKTNKFINTYMDEEKIKNYFAHDYYKSMNTENIIFPLTNKYYEPIKRVLSLKDLEVIFNGYDLNNCKPLSNSLKDFLFKKHNLITVVDGYYSGLIDNLGMILSKWDKIEEYAKVNDIDLSKQSIISIENILSIINFTDNKLCKSLNKNIIKSISEDGCFEINDLNKRISILDNLYKESFKHITSTIPYLCYKDDIYRLEVLDNYNSDILVSLPNSLYKVGAIGNDFLHYTILNKNGIQIGLYKENILQNKILGVRNGNTLYLSIIEGTKDENINRLLHLFANELVRITISDAEPIEFVTIVNNDIYTSRNGLKLDTTMCPFINDPINKMYYDYEVFASNPNLINNDDFYTNYEDNISTLLASSTIVDKNNFKYYDAEDKYYRKRNNAIKLSNNIGEEYLNRIDTIIYLCHEIDNSIDIDNIVLSNTDTIYLGDDYCLFVYENSISKYVLPYDSRALKEIDLILESINKN